MAERYLRIPNSKYFIDQNRVILQKIENIVAVSVH